MTGERWKDFIRIDPEFATTQAAADRARRTALARFREVRRARSFARPAGALAAALLVLVFAFALFRPAAEAPTGAAASQGATKVQFMLSDGTKVQWVFDDRFAL